jgi:transposase InsO family protein
MITAATMSGTLCCQFIAGRTTQYVFGRYLDQLLKTAPSILGVRKADILLLLDNAPIHSTHWVTSIVKKHSVFGITIPPYHPELNLVEQVFFYCKQSMRPY